MNLNSGDDCLTLALSSGSLSPVAACGTPPDGLTVSIPASEQPAVSFSGPATIQFTTQGLPTGACVSGCTITINDTADNSNSKQVRINAEGYIYAP